YSAVERHLTTETIVICDYLNYIKGYRCQLYCVSRNIGTSYCVMFCACTPEDSTKFNSASNAYSPEVHADLVTLFEEPEGRNRWDSPLFTVLPSDPPLIISHQIVSTVVRKTTVRPNLSTVVKPLTETNYLAEMDALVSSIIQAILDAQKGGGTG
ncbi:chromatin associated protein KTI12, partial [Cladochytrium replicatum]